MRLIPNAAHIARRAHSMWANYLGILCLLVPEIVYLVSERDTNPRLWWALGLALLIYGTVGRLFRQGIDHD